MIILFAIVALGTTPILMQFSHGLVTIEGGSFGFEGSTIAERKAPIAISGDNIYIVWFTDRGTPNTNGEVIFRTSNDGGTTFVDKINLSNTNDTDSINAKIAADGDNVIVTWWERNATSNEPVVRMSTDNGATFGPLLKLAVMELSAKQLKRGSNNISLHLYL